MCQVGKKLTVIDESNIRGSVLKLAIPSVLEQLLVMVVGVVSTILVGRIGSQALSAVGLVNTLIGFIIALFVALSTGCTVLVARLMGEEDYKSAKDAVRHSVILGAFISIFLSVLFYIFSKQIIMLFFGSVEQAVREMANDYFRVSLFTFPLTLTNVIISGAQRGTGDTKTPMVIASTVNVINVILSMIFIYGANLFFITVPSMGIHGAAIGVATARGIGGLLSIISLSRGHNVIRFDIREKMRFNIDIVRRILKVGIPASFEQILMQGGFLMLQVVIAGMGTVAIAVYQIGMNINSIAFIPVWGFGIAATTLIGQSLGANKPDIAEKMGWETLKLAEYVTIVLTTALFIFAEPLIRVYSSEPEVISIGIKAIRIFSLSQPFLCMVVVFSGSLRGAGDINYVMITSFVGIWLFRVAVTAVFGYWLGMGIMAVWFALLLDFSARAVMYLIRFRHGKWKYIKI
jgi:putative MATE family efflux protein